MTPLEINQMLDEIPSDDRVVALLVSILMRESEAVPSLVKLLAALTALASHLSKERRFLIAELLRDAADQTERVQQVERV